MLNAPAGSIKQSVTARRHHRQAVYNAIRSLADMQLEGPGDHLLRCMSDIADAYQDLDAREAPGQVLTTLQGLIVACAPHLSAVWARYLDHYLETVFGWVPAAAKELRAVGGGPRGPRLPRPLPAFVR